MNKFLRKEAFAGAMETMVLLPYIQEKFRRNNEAVASAKGTDKIKALFGLPVTGKASVTPKARKMVFNAKPMGWDKLPPEERRRRKELQRALFEIYKREGYKLPTQPRGQRLGADLSQLAE